jgi:hypothetical protein
MSAADRVAPSSHRFSVRIPRPLWLGVAAVVLIVVAAGLSFGLPIYRQHAAIREIGRLGGSGEVHYKGPQWLQRLLGYQRTQFLGVITVVRLGGTDFGDSDMWFLSGLGSVERVVLWDTRVTDSGLVHLRSTGRLTRVYLHGTQVTDAGIQSLTALPQLRVLDVSSTEITDTGLAQLRKITTLERLYIDGTRVTDAGVADLQRALPGLNMRR